MVNLDGYSFHKFYILFFFSNFMITAEQFYADYDKMIQKICEPYNRFLVIGANAIQENARSICDLGIGTGNFSFEIKQRMPNITIYGIDINENSINVARNKLGNAKIFNRDLFSMPLPNVNYMVSSLTTHHFSTDTRIKKLTEIVKSARMGFVNFDIMLFNGDVLDDVIQSILLFAKKSFSEKQDLEQIEYEMRTYDNPMPLEEQRFLFESLGMKFDLLSVRKPFAVYHTYWPTRN